MEYREKLERALPDAPILELTIQSSATLIKGEKIQINALGLVSHESRRTNRKIQEPDNAGSNHNNVQGYSLGGQADGQVEEDLRDGFVFFGCKKSIKEHQSNLDSEQTTIVSFVLYCLSLLNCSFFWCRKKLSTISLSRIRTLRLQSSTGVDTFKSSMTAIRVFI